MSELRAAELAVRSSPLTVRIAEGERLPLTPNSPTVQFYYVVPSKGPDSYTLSVRVDRYLMLVRGSSPFSTRTLWHLFAWMPGLARGSPAQAGFEFQHSFYRSFPPEENDESSIPGKEGVM